MAFEAILVPRTAAAGWRRLIMPFSILAHGVALSAGAAHSLWQVEEMPLPAVVVTLAVAPPAPPPPPAPKRSSSHPRAKPVDRGPKVISVPKEAPKKEPEPEAKDDHEEHDPGETEGSERGVPGGVFGGAGNALPLPLESKGPKLLSARQGHGLLAIDPNKHPYKVDVPEELLQQGDPHSTLLEICVTEQGVVSSVKILRASIPAIDLQIPSKVKRWLYKPYLVNGRPSEFCYPLLYTVQ